VGAEGRREEKAEGRNFLCVKKIQAAESLREPAMGGFKMEATN
jgi:hypothetical protein